MKVHCEYCKSLSLSNPVIINAIIQTSHDAVNLKDCYKLAYTKKYMCYDCGQTFEVHKVADINPKELAYLAEQEGNYEK